MWNLLAKWENPETQMMEDVTIITNYYEPENKWVHLIAIRKSGEFITGYIGSFKSQNKSGFISKDTL